MPDRILRLRGRDASATHPIACFDPASLDLRAQGIGEAQAAELRTRLKTFAEDWERPEADVYDKDPAI